MGAVQNDRYGVVMADVCPSSLTSTCSVPGVPGVLYLSPPVDTTSSTLGLTLITGVASVEVRPWAQRFSPQVSFVPCHHVNLCFLVLKRSQ